MQRPGNLLIDTMLTGHEACHTQRSSVAHSDQQVNAFFETERLVQSPAVSQVGLQSFCQHMRNRRRHSRSIGASSSFTAHSLARGGECISIALTQL